MTNGEKLKEVFSDIQIFNVTENEQREKFIHIRLGGVCQAIELDWWNAEYKEPTTKNDLGVEYISRSELMAILSDYYDTTVEYRSMLKEIASLPSATPQEPKTGHWNDIPKYKDIAWYCSECERFTTMKHNYCPKCGCRMVEPQEREEV